MGWYVGKGVIVVMLRTNVQMWITGIWAQKWGQCAILHMGRGLRRGGWVLRLEMGIDIQVGCIDGCEIRMYRRCVGGRCVGMVHGLRTMFQRGSCDLWLWRGFCIGSWLRRFRWGGQDGFGVTGCPLGENCGSS